MSNEPLEQKLDAATQLLRDASELALAQESKVARMRAAGLNTKLAENLLDAYTAGVRIMATKIEELERQLAVSSKQHRA